MSSCLDWEIIFNSWIQIPLAIYLYIYVFILYILYLMYGDALNYNLSQYNCIHMYSCELGFKFKLFCCCFFCFLGFSFWHLKARNVFLAFSAFFRHLPLWLAFFTVIFHYFFKTLFFIFLFLFCLFSLHFFLFSISLFSFSISLCFYFLCIQISIFFPLKFIFSSSFFLCVVQSFLLDIFYFFPSFHICFCVFSILFPPLF